MRGFFKVFKWISKIGVGYAIFLGVILTVLTVIIAVDTNIGTGMAENEAMKNAELVAAESENIIDSYMQTCMEAVKLTSHGVESLMSQSASVKDIKSLIIMQTENYAEVIDSNYTGLYGLIRGSYVDGVGWVPDKSYSPKSRPWYTDAVKAHGEVALVSPYMDSQTKKVTMSMSKLLRDGQSVVSIDLNLDKVQEYTETIANNNKNADVAVITSDGTIVADSVSSRTLNNIFGKSELLHAYSIDDLTAEKEGFMKIRHKGKSYYAFYSEVYNDWYVITSVCVDSMNNRQATIYTVHMIAIIVIWAGLLALFCDIGKKRHEASKNYSQMYSISGIYSTMDLINLEEDTFQMVRCDGKELRDSQEGMTVGAHRIMRETMWSCTSESSQNKLFTFIDLKTLDDRMQDTDTISIEYLDNNNKWCRGRFTVVERKRNKHLRSVLWMIEPIDKEKREREHLEWLSETDRLTGIMNRGGGEAKIRQIIETGGTGMLAILDADHFKSINDTFGHQVGDEVIIAIANCLKKSFRDVDVVMRLGGDEFAVFVNDMKDQNIAKQIIDRFIERVHEIDIPQITDRKIEVSVGAAFLDQTEIKDFESLYKKADSGVYRSKKIEGSFVTFV
ncbi:MAG: diguanylate cyclase [Lachnospiraceae bacterium]|nr:diguanylate cyclase [Lachnospiraceae bacterium]